MKQRVERAANALAAGPVENPGSAVCSEMTAAEKAPLMHDLQS